MFIDTEKLYCIIYKYIINHDATPEQYTNIFW